MKETRIDGFVAGSARALFLVLLWCLYLEAQGGVERLSSPSGELEIAFLTVQKGAAAPEGGQLAYEVSFRGQLVIARSNLGLQLEGRPLLGSAVRIVSAERGSADETYTVVHGKSNPVRNRYNRLKLELEETTGGGRRLILEARAYDEGVAFRYVVPKQPGAPLFRLVSEQTEFRLPADGFAYALYLRGFRTSYEDDYTIEPVSGIEPDRLIALPLLLEVPGAGWVAITEAHLENYAGMYLRRDVPGSPVAFRVDLPPNPDEPNLKVLAATPHQTPWRVVMVAANPGRFIESNLIINLNPPNELTDTSWIKPGKSAWDWWFGHVRTPEGFTTGMDTRTFKYLIDFAAEAGFDYVLVDEGWSDRVEILQPKPDVDLQEILRYASSKKVGIWLWLHWTGVDKYLEQAFPLYEKWGVKGVKIDFMDRDDQWMVNWYRRVVRKAAEHHLMVDFHGAYKPCGMRRTLPNLMTREGVLGLEYTKWSARANPEHNVMLPFTRLLAGPMDYTPGGFDNVTKAQFRPRFHDPVVMGTRAHQLAMFVVYESPFMVVCDHPSAYRGEAAFQFIRDVPVTWDETRFLDGFPGDYVLIARRKGQEWYVGAMTDWTPRVLDLPLAFLGQGSYVAEIYADAPDAAQNPKNVRISRTPVTSSSVLKIEMAPGGGWAARIRPK